MYNLPALVQGSLGKPSEVTVESEGDGHFVQFKESRRSELTPWR